MAHVKMRENEDIESLISRFKREVKADGTIEECRKREFFLKKALKRKAKSKAARLKRK